MNAAITLELAQRAIAAAIAHGLDQGLNFSVSVVDAAGREIASARSDRAGWFTIGVARAKARTAANFRRDTEAVARTREQWPDVFDLAADQMGFRATTLPGGVVINHGDALIGAIGVSGALPEQDVDAAQAGIAVLTAALGAA